MSELTPCNRCTLDRITEKAMLAGKGVRYARIPITEEMGGWIVVEVDGEAVAWFMELSEKCCC